MQAEPSGKVGSLVAAWEGKRRSSFVAPQGEGEASGARPRPPASPLRAPAAAVPPVNLQRAAPPKEDSFGGRRASSDVCLSRRSAVASREVGPLGTRSSSVSSSTSQPSKRKEGRKSKEDLPDAALQFTMGLVGEEDDVHSGLALQQEYDAITILATAHLLHSQGIAAAEDPQACLSPTNKAQHAALFLDALKKVSAMQVQSAAARDKVLELGRSYKQECRRRREVEGRLEAVAAERDLLLQERRERREQRSAASSAPAAATASIAGSSPAASSSSSAGSSGLAGRDGAGWEEVRRSLQLERERAQRLQERHDKLAAEHDELMARDLTQSHAMQRAKATEQQLAAQLAQSLAEQVRLTSSLAQEKANAEHLRGQLAQKEKLADERESLAQSLKLERDSRRGLQARLEQLTAERDDEIIKEMFHQKAWQGEGVRNAKPCRAA